MQAVPQTSKGKSVGGRVHDDRPRRFKKSRKRAVAKRNQIVKTEAFKKFVTFVPQPYFFSLTHKDLDIPKERAHPSLLYKTASLEVWRKTLKAKFKGCFYFALEVGGGDFKDKKRGLLHAHVIAARDDGPARIKRDSQKCKAGNRMEGLLDYLNKIPEAYSLEAHMDYQAARIMSKSRRAPRTRGWIVSKERQAWNRDNTPSITLWPFD
jgi:hypothetical protein